MDTASKERLKLAFAYDIVRRMVDADDQISDAETKFVMTQFPWSLLEIQGLVDQARRFTPAFDVAVADARAKLPTALPLEEKLALISLFVDASVADDEFHHNEGDVLVEAAHALGVSTAELMNHLGTLPSVGDVDMPSPEE
jgi:uncharacterized tellurite resistance protein B-like protein